MNTQRPYILKAVLASVLFAAGTIGFQSCSNSKVNAAGSSIYANPETLTFTPEQYSAALRRAYLDFYSFPPASAVDEIENAKDSKAAEIAYNSAIDNLVSSGIMRKGLLDYCYRAIGVGSASGNDMVNMPCNLFVYVILQNKPMKEFILADYGVDNAGNVVSSDYASGPPDSAKAGYLTMQSFVDMYMNAFQFKMLRETMYGNLCMTAPFTRVKIYGWSEATVNSKYRESGGIRCASCHAGGDANGGWNALRFAFHNYNGNNRTYNTNPGGIARGNNYYGMESNDGSGGTLEPRDANDNPIPANVAETTMYKVSENGAIVDTPRALASEIVKLPGFTECWTERFLTLLLETGIGHPGQNAEAPNNFSETVGQKEYLQKWAAVFAKDGKPSSFIKEFLKSGDYLILGVTEAK